MFGKTPIEELLDLYSLEELFEVLEIEPRVVLEILLEGGHITLPDYVLEDYESFSGL
jgi:hypothetical protein